MWNKIKILKNSNSRIYWNWPTRDRDNMILEEISKIAPPWVHVQEIRETSVNEDDEFGLNKEFTKDELNRALRQLKNKTSPGQDHVENTMIKKLPGCILKELLEIFNTLFKEGKIIQGWRIQTIAFIDKPGKKKVRSIALASCLGKLFERMINERLVWWAEKKKIFNKNQNGFRRGRSCINNLT